MGLRDQQLLCRPYYHLYNRMSIFAQFRRRSTRSPATPTGFRRYGISSRQRAHSAHRLSPPAGTTNIAAIIRSASPQRRQIIRSPARCVLFQHSAMSIGSSISSTRTKLRPVSKDFPPEDSRGLAMRFIRAQVPPNWATGQPTAHASRSIPGAPRLARPVGGPGESRIFRAPAAPDVRWFLAATRRPGRRCPYG